VQPFGLWGDYGQISNSPTRGSWWSTDSCSRLAAHLVRGEGVAGSNPATPAPLKSETRGPSVIPDEGVRLDLVEKGRSLNDVGRLARRQRQRDRVAECIEDGVDLCSQAAAGTADGLILAVFFWAPALC
jgi:hypothetical protein